MADEKTMSSRGFVISLFVIAALVCCGTPIAGAYLYHKDKGDEPGMRAAGEAYLTAAIEGDDDTAYDLLCESDRRKQPRPTSDSVPDPNGPTGFRITDIRFERPSEAPTQRIVTAEISYAVRQSREVDLYLEKQDGAWKVCAPPTL